ncbi:uncharacterized protein PV09_01908 [Verruconis gallopava]|uniref:Membrane insertase YidC/Oxa/ALB C-terminal domain-containing protein n=1 Tax=Verruconis gallopava TaxID=253628 RepID=A0A0D2AJF9_9PEZI|nr:uncharacterized protein PV09_01908 [Verruconis gallopava]KIW07013.1 hypothetical protein PV09_01908 [Verruconis gallopava]
MPPSRGIWATGRLASGISRQPIAARINVRTLTSTSSLVRQHGVRANAVPRAALPVTGYVLASGRANLSLWPFSSSSSKSSQQPVPEGIPDGPSSAPAPSAASTPSETAQSFASSIQDAAGAASAQAQSSLEEAARAVTGSTETADAAAEAASINPVLLDNITQIGQLKQLGLDYGWGPTSCVEWVVEHIHVYAGTPWYGTIILSAIAMRLLMIYPFYRMSNQQAKLQRLHPQLQHYMAEYQAAQVSGDKLAAQIASKQVSIVRRKNGVSMGWMLAPVFAQGVFGFGAFKLTRAMAALPVPGFETGGIAWLTNLTLPDPYFITPIALGVTMHLMARWAQVDASATADPSVAKMTRPLGLYVFPALMFLFTFWQSAALQISFLTATMFGTIQNLLFRNAKFREMMGMEPLGQRKALNLSAAANLTAASGEGSKSTPGQAAAPQQNPFKDNPFANLNTSRPLKTSGSVFESGVRYQAPSAAETLAAGPPRASSSSPQAVETPKDGNFVTRELKNARKGLGSMVEGITEKGKTMMANQTKAGDKGRSAKFLSEARRYEEQVRAREEKAREMRGR